MHGIQGLYRRLRYGSAVLVVSGLPRSGTSMLMQMLHAGGVEVATDEIRQADVDNPRGYFELERVKDLDKPSDKSWVKQARGKAIKVISALLEHLPMDNNYRVIFVHRDIAEVLASQNKMLTHRDASGAEVDDDRMRANYQFHLKKVDYLLRTEPHFCVLHLEHREVLQAPLEQAQRIREFLGCALNVEAMACVVDPRLYRNRMELDVASQGGGS